MFHRRAKERTGAEMMLRSTIRDCLYLNWALPVEGLPEPPRPLRWQRHSWAGRDYVFASALLFHQDAIRFAALPIFRLRHPQLNLRLYVLDDEGTPSVLFRRMLMPAWMAPGVRLVTNQPASRAKLDFPHPSREVEVGSWSWRVERNGSTMEVRAWPDSPTVAEGPRLGDWAQSARYFQERPRGYAEGSGLLHRIDARHPPAATWPMKAEVAGEEILAPLFRLQVGDPWPALHSAFLCPEVPFVFELGLVPKMAVTPSMPQPAASRSRVAAAFRSRAAL
jgi:hypothetical protein